MFYTTYDTDKFLEENDPVVSKKKSGGSAKRSRC